MQAPPQAVDVSATSEDTEATIEQFLHGPYVKLRVASITFENLVKCASSMPLWIGILPYCAHGSRAIMIGLGTL
jgi:hypothetical protein